MANACKAYGMDYPALLKVMFRLQDNVQRGKSVLLQEHFVMGPKAYQIDAKNFAYEM